MRVACATIALALFAFSGSIAGQARRPPARRPPAPPPALKTEAPAIICPDSLGVGVKTGRLFCDVMTGRDPAGGILIPLPPHRGPLATWTAWVAPKTLRPADAAKQVGMSEAQLREINRIPPRMLVKAGSTLLVPRGDASAMAAAIRQLLDNPDAAAAMGRRAQARYAAQFSTDAHLRTLVEAVSTCTDGANRWVERDLMPKRAAVTAAPSPGSSPPTGPAPP